MEILTPNDVRFYGKSDSESINNAIKFAKENGINSVTIPKINKRTNTNVWTIDSAIILCSDLEIVIDNCILRQADCSFDNVFRNFDCEQNLSHKICDKQHNIIIRGVGNAVIDGGKHNGLTEFNCVELDKLMTHNNLILLHNLKHFVITGIKFTDPRWWAINLYHCSDGLIENLIIKADSSVPNQDGVDLRVGCHNITIRNLCGRAGDDFIALSAIGGVNKDDYNYIYRVDEEDEDIHDVSIRDIFATSVTCTVICIRNMDGRKVYNINIDNIHETDDGVTSTEYPVYNLEQPFNRRRGFISPYALLRIGQGYYYYKRPSILGETYNISATNLYCKYNSAIMINVTLDKAYFGNIFLTNDADYVVTTKSDWPSHIYGADIRDTVFENIYYDNTDNNYGIAFDFDKNQKDFTLKNVVINNAFLGNCENPVVNNLTGEITVNNLFANKNFNGEK